MEVHIYEWVFWMAVVIFFMWYLWMGVLVIRTIHGMMVSWLPFNLWENVRYVEDNYPYLCLLFCIMGALFWPLLVIMSIITFVAILITGLSQEVGEIVKKRWKKEPRDDGRR